MKREHPRVRFGAHTKVQRTVLLAPQLDAWVQREATLAGCSFSEMMNRLLGQHLDLRQQLSSVLETPADEPGAPIFHVVLEQLKEAVCHAMDAVTGEVRKTRSSLDFVKAMIDRSTHELLQATTPDAAKRYSRWIEGVQSLTKGDKS